MRRHPRHAGTALSVLGMLQMGATGLATLVIGWLRSRGTGPDGNTTTPLMVMLACAAVGAFVVIVRNILDLRNDVRCCCCCCCMWV